MLKAIPTFFDARMAADTTSFSPSAAKPAMAVMDWLRHHMAVEVKEVRQAPVSALCLAHSPAYVDGVLSGTEPNGFLNTDAAVAQALPWMVGSLMTAAAYLLDRRRKIGPLTAHQLVACSPTSGFHHAKHGKAAGYCTFNGLVVTAMHLVSTGRAKRVGILDFDYHFGDGTESIIQQLKLDRYIEHYTCGSEYTRPQHAEHAVRKAALMAKKMGATCDIVLYQAGGDQHIDDPLGGLLTTEQMLQRDRGVFRACKQYDIPLVWNLAGGYQRDVNNSIEPVLALHRQTMQACIDIYINEENQ